MLCLELYCVIQPSQLSCLSSSVGRDLHRIQNVAVKSRLRQLFFPLKMTVLWSWNSLVVLHRIILKGVHVALSSLLHTANETF